MPATFKQCADFFRQIEADQVEHSDKTYLAHTIGVYNDLKAWSCPQEICLAGLFHSIYGTEIFQAFSLPVERRDEVRELIGERAELLAYWNCVMDRETFDANLDHDGPYTIRDRITNETVAISEQDLDDLCTIHLCDWLEQVGRSQNWGYRRRSYEKMAQRLGGIAAESQTQVFAQAH